MITNCINYLSIGNSCVTLIIVLANELINKMVELLKLSLQIELILTHPELLSCSHKLQLSWPRFHLLLLQTEPVLFHKLQLFQPAGKAKTHKNVLNNSIQRYTVISTVGSLPANNCKYFPFWTLKRLDKLNKMTDKVKRDIFTYKNNMLCRHLVHCLGNYCFVIIINISACTWSLHKNDSVYNNISAEIVSAFTVFVPGIYTRMFLCIIIYRQKQYQPLLDLYLESTQDCFCV